MLEEPLQPCLLSYESSGTQDSETVIITQSGVVPLVLYSINLVSYQNLFILKGIKCEKSQSDSLP